MSKATKRCQCGGMMTQATKFDSLKGKDGQWWVCPFCRAQQPVVGGATQDQESRDEVLTQPHRG